MRYGLDRLQIDTYTASDQSVYKVGVTNLRISENNQLQKAFYSKKKNISSYVLNLCDAYIKHMAFESNEALWGKAKREMPSRQNETNQILYSSENKRKPMKLLNFLDKSRQ